MNIDMVPLRYTMYPLKRILVCIAKQYMYIQYMQRCVHKIQEYMDPTMKCSKKFVGRNNIFNDIIQGMRVIMI